MQGNGAEKIIIVSRDQGSALSRLLKNSFKYGFNPFAVIPVKTGIQSFQYVTGYPLSRV